MSGAKVLVAMSGGVDSSVAAHLVQESGDAPLGVFMRSGVHVREDESGAPRCCSAEDALDARQVARRLGVPFYALNFAADFERLIDRFSAEYGAGRTPNPCVLCNRDLKFGRLFEYADLLGASHVATGHYARIVRDEEGRARLARGADRAKDQSYVLFPLAPAALERVRLPLGEMTKAEVREVAAQLGLPVHEKAESQDICFVEGTVGELVRARRPDLVRPGPILDLEGRELGRHEGIVHFTIGQRRGLGVAVGAPRYVVEIRPETAAVVIGPAEACRAAGLAAEEVVWHAPAPTEGVRAEVQVRYRHTAAPATVLAVGPDGAEVRFDVAQHAVTPGQAAVFYEGDRVLGGGWIARALRD